MVRSSSLSFRRLSFKVAVVVVVLSFTDCPIRVLSNTSNSNNEQQQQQQQPMLRSSLSVLSQQQQQQQQHRNLGIATKIMNDNNNNNNLDNAGTIISELPLLTNEQQKKELVLLQQQEKEKNEKKNNNKTDKHQRLTAVVHVGPEKTGTTSIQFAMHYLEGGLLQDNYIRGNKYFVDYDPRSLLDCFTVTGLRDEINKCNMNVYKNIQQVGYDGYNVVISAENFFNSKINLQQLKNDFLKPWDDIVIVMYYRRYFDWWVSLDRQGNKKKNIPERRSIVKHLQREYNLQKDIQEKYVIGVYQRYKEYFTNIQIINMHDIPNGDVRIPFFCSGTAIPNSPNTCIDFNKLIDMEEQERAAKSGAAHANTRYPIIYEEIAYYAKEEPLNLWIESSSPSSSSSSSNSNSYLTMNYVTNQIRQYHEIEKGLGEYDFPDVAIICPEKELYQWIYNKSIEYENLLFPEYHKKQGKIEMEQIFYNDTTTHYKQTFCYINATTILYENLNEWKEFFHKISV